MHYLLKNRNQKMCVYTDEALSYLIILDVEKDDMQDVECFDIVYI